MKQYKVIIKFNDGDGIDAKVVAWNQSDALQRIMTNEQAIDFIDTDELLEVTPESLRIRKKILDPTLRKRAGFKKNS